MGESLLSSSSAWGLLPAMALPWHLQGPSAGHRAEMLLTHLWRQVWKLLRIGWRAGAPSPEMMERDFPSLSARSKEVLA